ncbi:hypothetical protein M3O75_03225 [Klebsiella pneumoniae]|nr:hypothetical protein [Klebsiella pneumoniae]
MNLTDKTTAYQGKTFADHFFLQNGEGRCHHNRFAKLTDTAVLMDFHHEERGDEKHFTGDAGQTDWRRRGHR